MYNRVRTGSPRCWLLEVKAQLPEACPEGNFNHIYHHSILQGDGAVVHAFFACFRAITVLSCSGPSAAANAAAARS